MPQYRAVHRKNRSLLKEMQRKGGQTAGYKDFIIRVENGQKLGFLMNNEKFEKENIRRLEILKNHPNQKEVHSLVDLLVASIDDDKPTGSLADTAFVQASIRANVLLRIKQFRRFPLSQIRAVTLYFAARQIPILDLPKKRNFQARFLTELQKAMQEHGGKVRDGSYWFCSELGSGAEGKVVIHAHGLVSGDYINFVDEHLRVHELVSKLYPKPLKMQKIECRAANSSNMSANEQRDYAVGNWAAYALKLTTHQKITTKYGERSCKRVPLEPHEEVTLLRFYDKQRIIS